MSRVAATQSATVTRSITSGNSYTWDTTADLKTTGGAAINTDVTHTYALTFTAFDADGFMTNRGTATITVGPNGSSAQLTAATKPPVVTFSPASATATRLVLHYRPKGNLSASFTAATLMKLSSGLFKFDASSLSSTTDYEYYYDAFDANGALLSRNNGYFRPDNDASNNAANREANAVINSLNVPELSIHRRQTHDAFGAVDSETDGLGNTTTFTYNALGLMTSKRDPLVNATLANGFVQAINPLTTWQYDLNGHAVATTDANGQVNKQRWNDGTSQSTLAQEWHADGGTKTTGYDVFGNARTTIETVDATTQRRTDYSYDKNHQLIRIDRPTRSDGSHAYDTYTYDLYGQRLTHGDALGRIEKTFYDAEGRIVKTVSAEGRTTTYSYVYRNDITTLGDKVAGGFRKTTTDANGRKRSPIPSIH